MMQIIYIENYPKEIRAAKKKNNNIQKMKSNGF